MKIESQCATWEQCKQLNELGVNAKGYFMYETSGSGKESIHEIVQESRYHFEHYATGGKSHWNHSNDYPAYTVAELGVLLPGEYGNDGWIETHKPILNKSGFYCGVIYYDDDHERQLEDFQKETEAQARAAMLIHLLENNLVTPSECNNRLLNA